MFIGHQGSRYWTKKDLDKACHILIDAVELKISLRIGITLPQVGHQPTRENVIQIAQNVFH